MPALGRETQHECPPLQLVFSISVKNWDSQFHELGAIFCPSNAGETSLLSFPEVAVSWQPWCGEEKPYNACSGLGAEWAWGGFLVCQLSPVPYWP